MAKTATTPATLVPGLLVTTKTPERVHAAGLDWAGASHVPVSTLSAGQVEQLRGDERLKVEDLDIEAPAA